MLLFEEVNINIIYSIINSHILTQNESTSLTVKLFLKHPFRNFFFFGLLTVQHFETNITYTYRTSNTSMILGSTSLYLLSLAAKKGNDFNICYKVIPQSSWDIKDRRFFYQSFLIYLSIFYIYTMMIIKSSIKNKKIIKPSKWILKN